MPAKKSEALTDEERARRIRDLATESGTSDDPAAFERAFKKVVKPERHGVKTGSTEKPEPSVN